MFDAVCQYLTCMHSMMSCMYSVLAAWMRLKYPQIAIGAVAASAPILQFEDIVPSDTFYKIVSADFKVFLFFFFLSTSFNARYKAARY